MFLDEMSTDLEPASYEVVLRSFIRRLERAQVRNAHLYQLLRERNFHLKRHHKEVVKLRKLHEEQGESE